MLQFMKPYCSHSFAVSFQTEDVPKLFAHIQVQFKHCSLNFTLHATFIQLLKKLSYILKGKQKL